jgi:hypothetical protein
VARWTLTPIAETDRFADFAPYVASIDDAGRVAFEAELRDGRTGLFVGDGGVPREAALSGTLVRRWTSHPDLDRDGALCAYAELASGGEALVVVRDGEARVAVGTGDRFTHIGPLGPTSCGPVAFRAEMRDGRAAVAVHREGVTSGAPTRGDASSATGAGQRSCAGVITTIAEGLAFQGLPIALPDGRAVFRADLAPGRHAVFVSDGTSARVLVETGDEVRALGRFPCATEDGTVVIDAALADGPAILRIEPDGAVSRALERAGFESVRGALLSETGALFFYATPPGGALGVYAAPATPIVAIGDRALGSHVVELALNPVSVAKHSLAIRLRLADGRQSIVRADRSA